MSQPFRNNPDASHESVVRDGVITGLLGAAIVAMFYLAVDAVRGTPLLTPSVLGQAFILHQPILTTQVDPASVFAYTAVHVLAFVIFGFVLAALVHASERSSLARYAMVQILIAFMVFFYGIVSVGSEVVRGLLPFVGVLVANALAGAVMTGWLWRHHPVLRARVAQTPLGATDGR